MSYTGRRTHASQLGAIGNVILGIVLFLLITGLWALLWVPPMPGLQSQLPIEEVVTW
jgi:tetrahydromethanopterin S-methyltransferase subunit B